MSRISVTLPKHPKKSPISLSATLVAAAMPTSQPATKEEVGLVRRIDAMVNETKIIETEKERKKNKSLESALTSLPRSYIFRKNN